MAIKVGVNGDKKETKDIFVGVNSAKHKVVKVVTSVNGERVLMYGEDEPPQDYYYYISSQKLIKTKDFETYKEIISNPAYTLSYNVTDGENIYVWDMQLVNTTYTLKNCYVVNKRDNVSTHACQYNNLPSGSMGIVGYEHKLYYKGLIYDTMYIFNSNKRDFYLVSSADGYTWNIVALLFSVTGNYFGSMLLDGISDGTDDYLIFMERYYSGNGNRLNAINLRTLTVTSLISTVYWDYFPRISVRVSNSEIIIHSFKPNANNTYSVKANNGQVTATVAPTNIRSVPTLYYDGSHYYGGGQSLKYVYYDNSALAINAFFRSMITTDDGVLAFDDDGTMYKIDASGNLETLMDISNLPDQLYSNTDYKNILIVNK